MAARKSKSAKARSTPKKKTAKGKKSAARTKAAARSKSDMKSRTKKAARTLPKNPARDCAEPEFAEVVIKAPACAKPRRSQGLAPLLSRLRAELGPDHQPAWLVNAAMAALIPINEAGASLFDIDSTDTAAVTLDQGMPALATLRKLADSVAKDKKPKRTINELLFWTPTGVRICTCQVTAHTVKGQIFFLVQSQDETVNNKTPVSDDAHQSAAQETSSLPRPPRDDAAILREIARRIRAGTRSQPNIADVPGELPAPNSIQPPAMSEHQSQTRTSTFNTTTSDVGGPHVSGALDQHQRAKLAHELRTPISAIIAASEIIKDERFGSLDNFHYRDYARDIHQSARHALQLIEQGLRSVAETAPDLNPPQTDRADLNHLVRSAVATTKHLAQKKNVSIAFVPGERDAVLQMDPTSVTQIVLNLLTNAVKFTESGGSVTAHVFSSIGEDIRVEVRDTGCGMTAADITQHLDVRSPKPPQARAGGGLGIGLALSRQLAESNGASLEIKSVPGRGTTACLAFPLRLLIAA